MRIGSLFLVAVVALSTGCRPGSAPDGSAAAPNPEAAPPALPPLVYAAPMAQGTEVGVQRARVVASFLSGVLGRRVDARLFVYAQLGDAVAAGQADIAVLPPLDYVRGAEGGRLRALRQALHGGAPRYRSVLFARADRRELSSLEALRGRSIAWVRPGSASGYHMPRFALGTRGLDPDTYFGTPSQLASHAEVCNAVLSGHSDVGASFTDATTPVAEARVAACEPIVGERLAELRVVVAFDPIPTEVVVVRTALEPALQERLDAALSSLGETDEGRRVLREGFASDGFVAPSAEDFEALRQGVASLAAPR
jgi:phosphonate transport system substrate-binding protein